MLFSLHNLLAVMRTELQLPHLHRIVHVHTVQHVY